MDKSNFSLLRVVIVSLFIILISAFMLIVFLRKSQVKTNEHTAVSSLKRLNETLKIFKEGNYQYRGRRYPQGYGSETNSGKLCALYYELKDFPDMKITLIGLEESLADCRADDDTDTLGEEGYYFQVIKLSSDKIIYNKVTFKMRPKLGYWYGLMMYYDDGKEKIPYDNEYSKDHYALVAFPAEYGSAGETTFIVNETGVVYSKDLGKSGYLDTYPGPDPIQHGWEIAE